MKKAIIILLAVIAVAGGGYYIKIKTAKPVAEEPKIRIAETSRGDVTQMIEASGSVVSNFDVEIKCKASGEIISLPYDTSDVVRKGDLLAELDPSEEKRKVERARMALDSSRASRESARQNLRIAERNLENSRSRADLALEAAKVSSDERVAKAERVAQLYENKLASREEYETARTSAAQAHAELERARLTFKELDVEETALEISRQNLKRADSEVRSAEINLDIALQGLEDTRVYSPMDGVVTARYVQAGQIISSGTTNVGGGTSIMKVSDLSRLYVLATVDESDIGQARVGQDVEITVDAHSGRKFAGRVERISPRGEAVQNVVTFEVKIEVVDGGGMMSAPGRSGRNRADAATAGAAAGAAPEAAPVSMESAGRTKRAEGAENGEKRERRKELEGSVDSDFRKPEAAANGQKPSFDKPKPETSASAPAKADSASSALSGLLKPQMTAHVKIIIAGKKDVVMAPAEAIWRKDGKFYVTLAAEGSEPAEGAEREVSVGISDGTNIEIIEGLEPGERLAMKAAAASSRWGARGGMPPMGGPMMRR